MFIGEIKTERERERERERDKIILFAIFVPTNCVVGGNLTKL